ncbi:hypothetical protein BSSX_1156 [Bacillus subtilis]|nr:hypothetical protein BSSX_1156 [Bacillus subtilis]
MLEITLTFGTLLFIYIVTEERSKNQIIKPPFSLRRHIETIMDKCGILFIAVLLIQASCLPVVVSV